MFAIYMLRVIVKQTLFSVCPGLSEHLLHQRLRMLAWLDLVYT